MTATDLVVSRRDGYLELVLYMILLFFIPARLVVPGFGAAGSPASLLALAMLALLIIERLGYRVPDPALTTVNPVAVALLGFAAWIVWSWSVGRTLPLSSLVSSSADRKLITIASLAGIAWFVIDRIRSPRGVIWLIDLTLLCSLFMCAVGLVQFYFGFDPIESIRLPGLVNVQTRSVAVFTRSIFNRPFGTALHAIEFGVVAASLLPLALWRARAGKRWHWFAVGFLALSSMISISRSAVLAAAIAMLVLFLGSDWRTRVNLAVGGLGFVIFAGSVIPGLVGTLRGLFTYSGSDPSVQARVDRTPEVLRLIAENRWFGRGFGTFTIEEDLLLDNQIEIMAIEMGVIGVALFVLLVLTVTWTGQVRLAPELGLDGLGTALTASILAVTISFYTFDAFFYHILMGLYIQNIGLVAVLWRLAHRSPLPLDRGRSGQLAVTPSHSRGTEG